MVSGGLGPMGCDVQILDSVGVYMVWGSGCVGGGVDYVWQFGILSATFVRLVAKTSFLSFKIERKK